MTDYEVIEDLKYYGKNAADILTPREEATLIKENARLLACIYSLNPLVRKWLINSDAIDAEFEEKVIENE